MSLLKSKSTIYVWHNPSRNLNRGPVGPRPVFLNKSRALAWKTVRALSTNNVTLILLGPGHGLAMPPNRVPVSFSRTYEDYFILILFNFQKNE